MFKRPLIILSAFFVLAAGASAGQNALKKVSFIPLWSPQAQFAGYYMAYEKGFYRDRGLDVNILTGGPRSKPGDLLASGKADFGLLWLSAAVREWSSGRRLVLLSQITQRSALMLMARKSEGINKPADLNGRKISVWEGDLGIQPGAFLRKFGVKARLVPQGYTVNLFLRGGVDAISGMWYNEYHTILNSGLDPEELTVFFYDKYGLNFPEDGLYASRSMRERDPRSCRAFAEGSLAGWDYAFAHEDETLDMVLKYMKAAGLPANRMHQRWMLRKMKELVSAPGGTGVAGTLSREDYERVAAETASYMGLKSVPAYKDIYRPAVAK